MKNFQLYLIIPAVLLVAFLFTPSVGYFAAQKQIQAREQVREDEIKQKEAAEDAKRLEIQKRAEADAIARQQENEAKEREREEAKRKAYEDAIGKLNLDIDTFTRETEAYAKESTDLEAQLSKLRDQKETGNRDTFDLAKQVELAKIERRVAEMEIQRMVGMVSRNLTASPLLVPPPVAPVAASGR